MSAHTAAEVLTALGACGWAGEPVDGTRMRDLFAAAKAHRDLPLVEVDRLLDEEAYGPRLAAWCIVDFQAQQRLTDAERRERFAFYLRRHDRISSWDMVDRAAPRVVGRYLVDRSLTPLHDLAAHDDPLRRRTAITAPLWFTRYGSAEQVAAAYDIARTLATDPDPVVHNAVGIYLKHAGSREPAALLAFLDEYAAQMPRAAVRLAVAKLAPAERARYVRSRSA